ncbi:hypothetical protein BGP77_00300 [Saccharospirillum sp. MSK14-1]|uniref:hypothetical protein n=1 Tax=Saccharospirillum sp. MSK14-1 TaxID=1897632 RepID=UPI000D3A836B|nr:hypothetical protein [Saccharospirillum sp. MSK14-1]PTY35808.1 hypothetical protein BGP77_00300 [Saccharospirillum sp. MSK14-1]
MHFNVSRKKYVVVIGYAICPFYISVPISLTAAFAAAITGEYSAILPCLLVSLAGLMFLLPAAVLGVFCYIVQVRRSLFSVIAVSLLGGVLAELWTFYIVGWGNVRLITVEDVGFGFYAGFITAIVSGFIFLPKKNAPSING